MLAVESEEAEAEFIGLPDASCGRGRAAASARPVPDDTSGLSTDYLNHYSEILMLIEMASLDASIAGEINAWHPIGYREYFRKSPLRRAPAAIEAYDALPDSERTAFEQNVEALDKLARAAILALQPPCHLQNMVLIGEVIGPAMRAQISRAAAFLNSGRAHPPTQDETQAVVDRLLAQPLQ